MTLAEARSILGLGPEENPRPHLEDFRHVREQLAEIARRAPNEILALRHRKALAEFDEALALLEKAPAAHEPPAAVEAAAAIEIPAAPETPPPAVFPVLAPAAATPSEAPDSPPPATRPPAVSETPAAPPDATPPAAAAPSSEPAANPPAVSDSPPRPKGLLPPHRTEISPFQPISDSPDPPPIEPPQPAAAIHPPPPAANSLPTGQSDQAAPPNPATGLLHEPPPLVFPKPAPEPEKPPQKSRTLVYTSVFLLLLIAGAAAGLWFLKAQEETEAERQARLVLLEKQGHAFIENRRWPEASKAFEEIERLNPGSETAAAGRRNIETGIAEEQTQFIAYWTGQAVASLEAGLWQDAEAAARQVLEKFPNETEASEILNRTAAARSNAERSAAISAARELLEHRQWEEAVAAIRAILADRPNDPEAILLLSEAIAAREMAMANLAKARELLAQAVARDQGQFDQEALELLREATALAPGDAEIAAQFEKMSAYTRTLRVPGDFATAAEAISAAKDKDRVVLGPGAWKGPLTVNVAVDLQGAGPAETRVECAAEEGPAITLGPAALGARITGISFRHESFAAGNDRFSAALVRGAEATFSDCRFADASGHGLAVIEGGRVTATRCRFTGNGWNGVAAIGTGSLLEVRESEASGNFEHGIESWEGAAVVLVKNRCEDNSRNGIHADNGSASATIEDNTLASNREFGIVLGSAATGKMTGNTARDNLLGGIVIRAAAGSLPVTGNMATGNHGPGLVLEKGLPADRYSKNTLSGNAGQQILGNSDLTADEPIRAQAMAANEDEEAPPPAAIPVPEPDQ